MSNTFFTSDTHFNHQLVSRLRGFDSTEKHDEHVVWAWNKRVRPADVVWHLGDVGMGKLERFAHYLEQLNGTIHLITGNHDRCAPGVRTTAAEHQPEWLQYFVSVQPFARLRADGRDVLLSHYPYTGEGQRDIADRYSQFRLPNLGTALIHGHTHDSRQRLSFDNGTPMLHVGWDAWRRPVDWGMALQQLRRAWA